MSLRSLVNGMCVIKMLLRWIIFASVKVIGLQRTSHLHDQLIIGMSFQVLAIFSNEMDGGDFFRGKMVLASFYYKININCYLGR